jgi:hypothetical protein
MLVRERMQRLQRTGQFRQDQVKDLERKSSGPAHRGGLEVFVVLGFYDEQDPMASRNATQPSSAAVARMMVRLLAAMARLRRA